MEQRDLEIENLIIEAEAREDAALAAGDKEAVLTAYDQIVELRAQLDEKD